MTIPSGESAPLEINGALYVLQYEQSGYLKGMSTMEDPMQQLHDKATRDIALSASEQAQLDTWYADQDQAENKLLASPQSAYALDALQTQIDTALAQLAAVSNRIQEREAFSG